MSNIFANALNKKNSTDINNLRTNVDGNTSQLTEISSVVIPLDKFKKISGEPGDTARMQRAIDFLISQGGGKLTIPKTKTPYLINGSLIISNAKDITIEGGSFETTTNPYLFKVENSSNIHFQDMKYSCAATAGSQKMVRVFKGENISLKNCSVINGGLLYATSDELTTQVDANGDYIQNNKNILISNCYADAGLVGQDVVFLTGCKNVLIERCTIKNTQYDGIKMSDLLCENIRITKCDISYCYDHAIDMYSGGRHLTIEDNDISYCNGGLSLKTQGLEGGNPAYKETYKAVVVKNRIRKCGIAMHIFRSRNMLIKDNHINKNGYRLDGKKEDTIISVSGNFQDIYIESNFFIENTPNVTVLTVSSSLQAGDTIVDSKMFAIDGNRFIDNDKDQILIQTVSGDTSSLAGVISRNQFRNNVNKCLAMRLLKCNLIISDNISIKNQNSGFVLNSATADTNLILSNNQHYQLVAGSQFGRFDSSVAITKQSNNSWNT